MPRTKQKMVKTDRVTALEGKVSAIEAEQKLLIATLANTLNSLHEQIEKSWEHMSEAIDKNRQAFMGPLVCDPSDTPRRKRQKGEPE